MVIVEEAIPDERGDLYHWEVIHVHVLLPDSSLVLPTLTLTSAYGRALLLTLTLTLIVTLQEGAPINFEIAVCGDQATGKTSLVHRYNQG